MALNKTLKIAFVQRGTRQRVIAARIHMHPVRLSKIVNGHIEPTAEEKKALAKALRYSQSQLFDEPDAVSA